MPIAWWLLTPRAAALHAYNKILIGCFAKAAAMRTSDPRYRGSTQGVRTRVWSAKDGNIDLLTSSVHSGMSDAVSPLKRLPRRAGRAEDARRIHVSGLEP